jgi:hypothetical protein
MFQFLLRGRMRAGAGAAARPTVLAVAVVGQALAGPAWGQGSPSHARAGASALVHRAADPADPMAAVPAVKHRSAFATYRRPADAPVGSWLEANRTVNRIGGWRTYAREAADSEAPASAPAPAAAPASRNPASGTAPAAHGHEHGKR